MIQLGVGGNGQAVANGGSRLEEKLLRFNMESVEWTRSSCSGSSGCWLPHRELWRHLWLQQCTAPAVRYHIADALEMKFVVFVCLHVCLFVFC